MPFLRWLPLVVGLVLATGVFASEPPIRAATDKERADLAPGLPPLRATREQSAPLRLDRFPPCPDERPREVRHEGTWVELAPPQRSTMTLLPDPPRSRLLVVANRSEWSVEWALALGDSLHWERVADKAHEGRPRDVAAAAIDSRSGRWIALSNEWNGEIRPYALEPGLYFARLTTSEQEIVRRFAVIR